MRSGKSSRDGLLVEVFKDLPGKALGTITTDFARRIDVLDSPEERREVSAKLISETRSVKDLKSYRPVSSRVLRESRNYRSTLGRNLCELKDRCP